MSLIFKALQRSRPSAPQTSVAETESPGLKNGVTWRKALLSPSTALIAGCVLFLSGLGAAQLIDFLSQRTVLSPRVAAATASAQDPMETYPVAHTADEGAPVLLQSGGEANEPEPEAADIAEQFEFIPARANHPADKAADRHEVLSGQKVADRSIAVFHPAPATSDGASMIEDPIDQHRTAGAAGDTQAEVSRLPGKTSMDPTREAFKNSPAEGIVAEDRTEAAADSAASRQAEHAKTHLIVSRLAHRLHGAIRSGDAPRSRKLLGQLAEIKGRDNPFVLKLAACSHIQEGNLDRARAMLESILADHPDDLEAGLNMAVVDIRQGHLDRARLRLRQLFELYPEEEKIMFYLGQLRR